jgi:hypothetical protein
MILHDKRQGRTEGELCDARGLFEHLFEGQSGYLNTFTGKQARFVNRDARGNELTAVRNRTWKYPEQASEAVESLLAESGRKRDAYFGVHLFEERQPGRRLASNAAEFVRALWVDGDGALVPDHYPAPTATVYSSSNRHHFYWRLLEPVPIDQAAALNRRMALDMGADTSKAGKASVLRLPGTFNYKRETPEPVTAKISDRSIEHADMDATVPAEKPKVRPRPKKRAPWFEFQADEDFDLLRWMDAYGMPYGAEVRDDSGRKWRLEECPIAPPGKEHSDSVYVGQRHSGQAWFRCYHNHGEGRVWQDVRPIYQPDCYVPWWVKVVSKNA